MESSVVGQNWIQVKNCNWWFSISVMVSYPQFMNNWGFGTKDIENKSRFKDSYLTKQFCPVTDRYLHFCAFTTDSATCTYVKHKMLQHVHNVINFHSHKTFKVTKIMFLSHAPLLVDFLLLFLRSRFIIFDCPARVSIIIRL